MEPSQIIQQGRHGHFLAGKATTVQWLPRQRRAAAFYSLPAFSLVKNSMNTSEVAECPKSWGGRGVEAITLDCLFLFSLPIPQNLERPCPPTPLSATPVLCHYTVCKCLLVTFIGGGMIIKKEINQTMRQKYSLKNCKKQYVV